MGVLDVVAPFAPGDLDATYKPGVDAVRVRRGIGMTGEAEIIAVGSKKWNEGALLGRCRYPIAGIDVEFVGGRFRRRTFGGIGWEGGKGSFGLWGEMALFQRRENHEVYRGGWSEAAFSGVSGVEVKIAENTIIGGAFMFQDFGVREPEDLTSVYSDAPYKEGWAFLGSASYGVVTVHRQLHPLVNGDIAGLINLIDNSTLWQPQLTISTGDGNGAEVVYLLTDGQYDQQVVKAEVKKLQSQRTRSARINVISCGVRDNEGFLRNLAAMYGGQYRFVSDEQLALGVNDRVQE